MIKVWINKLDGSNTRPKNLQLLVVRFVPS